MKRTLALLTIGMAFAMAAPVAHANHPAKRPTVVLLLHAGGWLIGNAGLMNLWIPVIHHMIHARAVSLNYPSRANPQTKTCNCVTASERYVSQIAERYRRRGFRVLALGWSAGGELADWLAARCEVDAAASISGPTNLVTWQDPEKSMIGIGPRAEASAASPIFHVRSCAAPMFLAGGSIDPVVPHRQQTRMRDYLHRHGLRARYQPYGGGHAAPAWVYRRAIRWMSRT